MPKSSITCFRNITSFAQSNNALYSASLDDKLTVFCNCDFHCMGPFPNTGHHGAVHGPRDEAYLHEHGLADRGRGRWCADRAKPQFQHDVCYSNRRPHGQHGHRMWNRDVVGAINIGCLFLAQALGLAPALWQRGTTDDLQARGTLTSPLSWAEIFGRAYHVLPFSLPSTLPPTGH